MKSQDLEIRVTMTSFRLMRLRACLEDRIDFLRLMLTRADGLKRKAIIRDIHMTNDDLKSLNGPTLR